MDDPVAYWRTALGAWAIPDEIRAAAPVSPWELTARTFVARARRDLAEPSGISYERAVETLPAGGTVLDVGVGAGAASLPLARRPARLTGVDPSMEMLAQFVALAGEYGATAATVPGRWPEVAGRVPASDVVVCHHVLYNVPDLAPFVTALTAKARFRVVVEISVRHPMAPWNPLWERIHGLPRPNGPTAADAVAAIAAVGLAPSMTEWERAATTEGMSYPELVATTGRRLCVGPERSGDIDEALHDLGVDPSMPTLGGPIRHLATIWWAGGAGGRSE
jgi:SAM-dependent methyltransferase